MAAISWNGVDGDWSLAADWSTGAVPTSADDVSILAPGSYLVTVDSGDVANSLNFDASQAALFEGAGSLTISGALTVNSGFVSLNEANTIGGVSVGAATLAIGASGALGTGAVAVNGGELLGTADASFANALALSGNVTIAAANGTTLNENASSYQLAANTTLNSAPPGRAGPSSGTPAPAASSPPWATSLSRPARSSGRTAGSPRFSPIARKPRSPRAQPSISEDTARPSTSFWARARSPTAARPQLSLWVRRISRARSPARCRSPSTATPHCREPRP